jgi:hypothetical protein
MAKTRGGAKRPFRNKKEYQRHLREMVRQGKATQADGSWGMVANPGMHEFMLRGYNFR